MHACTLYLLQNSGSQEILSRVVFLSILVKDLRLFTSLSTFCLYNVYTLYLIVCTTNTHTRRSVEPIVSVSPTK